MKVTDFISLQAYFRSKNIFEEYGIDKIGVFGSLSRGEPFKDIDLMVDGEISFKTLIRLQQRLEADLQTHVDIVIKDLAEPIILHRAMKDMRYATGH